MILNTFIHQQHGRNNEQNTHTPLGIVIWKTWEQKYPKYRHHSCSIAVYTFCHLTHI